MMSQVSKLVEWFEVEKNEHFKNEEWLVHEMKWFLTFTSKTLISQAIIFSRSFNLGRHIENSCY